MQIMLANTRGFRAGVDRAIGIVERALDLYGAPLYVRHETPDIDSRSRLLLVDDEKANLAVFVRSVGRHTTR